MKRSWLLCRTASHGRGFAIAGVCLVMLACSGFAPHAPTAPERCKSVTPTSAGPRVSVAEAEEESMVEIRRAPSAPQVAFGFQNSEWHELKDSLARGDELHAYGSGHFGGGYYVVRAGCVVKELITWID